MKKEELEKRLDNELENIFKEHETMHISSARHLAVKNLGLKEVNPYTKKGYIEPKNCLKWGTKVGSDIEIFISLINKCGRKEKMENEGIIRLKGIVKSLKSGEIPTTEKSFEIIAKRIEEAIEEIERGEKYE